MLTYWIRFQYERELQIMKTRDYIRTQEQINILDRNKMLEQILSLYQKIRNQSPTYEAIKTTK